MNLDHVTKLMGEDPEVITYNNGKNTVYRWSFTAQFHLIREFLQEHGWKENEGTMVLETMDWSIDYWYHLIDPKGIKCYVEGNLYYGGNKLVYDESND